MNSVPPGPKKDNPMRLTPARGAFPSMIYGLWNPRCTRERGIIRKNFGVV